MADEMNKAKEGPQESGAMVLIKIALVVGIPAVIFAAIKYLVG